MTACSPSLFLLPCLAPENEFMEALQQLQPENEFLRESLRELQSDTLRNPPPVQSQPSSTPSPTTCSSHPYVLEPTISLPDKFNSTRVYLRGFINQIQLIIRLQPQRYASDFSRLGLVVMLLSGPTQAWFTTFIKTSSPLLENFPAFIDELKLTFGKTDR